MNVVQKVPKNLFIITKDVMTIFTEHFYVIYKYFYQEECIFSKLQMLDNNVEMTPENQGEYIFSKLQMFDNIEDTQLSQNELDTILSMIISDVWAQVDRNFVPNCEKFHLSHTGFHAYQKTVDNLNSKVISFEKKNLFVTNQNKSGVLYFTIEKEYGNLEAMIELISSENNFICKKLNRGSLDLLNDSCGLYQISKTIYPRIQPNVNVVNDLKHEITHNKLTLLKDDRTRLIDDLKYHVITNDVVKFPIKAGRYVLIIYPYVGLVQKPHTKTRPFQCFSLVFPSKNQVFRTQFYKIVSKDLELKVEQKMKRKRKRALQEEEEHII